MEEDEDREAKDGLLRSMDCSEELGLYSKSCSGNKYHKQGQKANAKLKIFQTEVKDFLP